MGNGNTADQLFQSGMERYEKGEYNEACGYWQQCLSDDPLHAQALYYLPLAKKEVEKSQYIKVLVLSGEEEFAKKHYQVSLLKWLHILELDPHNAFAKGYLEQK